jgi:dihydroxyacetone kinase-like predicted kinase
VLGDGFKEIFYNAGSELVIDGGPTQNPSTFDIVSAIETVASSNVIVLPNHKNVCPAAIQAAGMTSKEVRVLRTSSAPEGLSALLAYMDDTSFEKNISNMEGAWKGVKSGEVAQASRSVTAGDVEVKPGDSIGIYRGEIRCSSASVGEAVMNLAASMLDAADEIITLFYGDAIGKQDAEELRAEMQQRFNGKTVELYYGGQPYAQYIISVE